MMNGINSENIKQNSEQGVKYRVIQNIYQEHELKYVLPFIKPQEDDHYIMDKIKERVGVIDGFSNEDMHEVILYATLTSEPEDVNYLLEHPELCEQCGWCCKNCNPILLKKEDIMRIGSFDNIVPYNDKYLKMKVPCIYLKNNKCAIYDKRPNSCRTFPISIKNLTLIVQRTKNCPMIFNLLVKKVERMCEEIKRRIEHETQ